jgi:hypothetical protein
MLEEQIRGLTSERKQAGKEMNYPEASLWVSKVVLK